MDRVRGDQTDDLAAASTDTRALTTRNYHFQDLLVR